ncbi:hypothetical protein KUF83_30110 [Streptomyces sp. BV286]|uniref:hypothetical protein n=1 Tax=Streptomyces sp. BV286 TaxID=2849672 RepID=UPI001C2EA579|nr:hypothetical protein [Streptomyces sp. BV286]MBV1940791.1 hypothetical protein [Streptomyces sp. BV286]
MSNTQELRVLEQDMGAGAITFEDHEQGVTYLFVHPDQSFEWAVKNVLKVCPELSLSRVQDLVRTHCKSVVEMNERLGVDLVVPRFEAAPDAGVIPPAPVKISGQHRRPRPPRWAKIAAVAAPAVASGMLLAQWLSPNSNSTTVVDASVSQDDKAAAGTYRSDDFEEIADGGALKCDPVGAFEAKCVDADGKVMYSEASVGTSTAFTFSYDLEKIGFRLFSDADSAAAWVAEQANRELYQNVRQHGRVVLWGTDATRLQEWSRSISEDPHGIQPAVALQSQHGGGMLTSANAGPLPIRLAVLAFGTLGVTKETVKQAVTSEDAQSFQLLRAVALVLGNADGSQLGIVPSGPSDAVAVVADAPSGPAHDDKEPHGGTAPVPVPDSVSSGPVAGTTPSGGAVTTPAPAPAPTPSMPAPAKPATDPEPVTAPAPEPGPVAEQPVEDPAPVVTPPESPPVEDLPRPDTLPGPPVQEDPEGDGLSLDALPMQWAA